MIKAIILDDGYHSKDVVIKSEENYKCVSLTYFLNSLCKYHNADYKVKTAHLEDFASEQTIEWFDVLSNRSYYPSVVQSCEEFERLWRSDEVVDGIDID